ncbi:MAG: hypothetical protein ABI351_05115 [Herbaspirillum sp.]
MSQIIAGRFHTFKQAEGVAHHLAAQNIAQQDISVFFVNPAGQHAIYPYGGDQYADPSAKKAGWHSRIGILIGGLAGLVIGGITYLAGWQTGLAPLFGLLLGAFFGTFLGTVHGMEAGGEPRPDGKNQQRDSGVMVAARVNGDTAARAEQVLRADGAQSVEQAEGKWENGDWSDFDPRVPPNADARTAAMFKE